MIMALSNGRACEGFVRRTKGRGKMEWAEMQLQMWTLTL